MTEEKINERIEQIKKEMANPELCNGTAEIYQKITGYARPVSQWNLGKKVEYSDRREYNM
jgi:anaerobic ribonucleoside-triphosphate reductase